MKKNKWAIKIKKKAEEKESLNGIVFVNSTPLTDLLISNFLDFVGPSMCSVNVINIPTHV